MTPIVAQESQAAGLASRRERCLAAFRVLALQEHFAKSGSTILDCLSDSFEPEAHYPCGEGADQASAAHFFYHLHAGETDGGHFHTFLGKAAIPSSMHPQIFPEIVLAPLAATPVEPNSGPRFPGVFSHLIAVGVDSAGQPDRLFTTNRWVTGETWYAADNVAALLPRFTFAGTPSTPAAVVGSWLADTLHVLRPVAISLLQERDRRLADWRRRRTRQIHVLDDRRLEIVSERRIDFANELMAATRV
jgi:hypothetical protein